MGMADMCQWRKSMFWSKQSIFKQRRKWFFNNVVSFAFVKKAQVFWQTLLKKHT